MTGHYLNQRLMPRYDLEVGLRLSPGDGFKGLPYFPSWF
jgi:hypothetical protein